MQSKGLIRRTILKLLHHLFNLDDYQGSIYFSSINFRYNVWKSETYFLLVNIWIISRAISRKNCWIFYVRWHLMFFWDNWNNTWRLLDSKKDKTIFLSKQRLLTKTWWSITNFFQSKNIALKHKHLRNKISN